MPPLPTWFVLTVFIAAIPLAAISARQFRKPIQNTSDDNTDSDRAVEFDGFIPDVERGGR